MTSSDDDASLRWNPEPLPEAPRTDPSTAPNGWVRANPEVVTSPGPAGLGSSRDDDDASAEEPSAHEPLAPPRHRAGRGKRKRDPVRSVVEWAAVIIGALVVALVVKTFLFQAFYIPSASMEPTLEQGDRVLVNKVSYDLHDINRGDVLVFERPEAWQPAADGIDDLIKRAIGLPGDVVEVRDGDVYIDGERLDEPYLDDGTRTEAGRNGATRWEVPEDHIFVMGDNRSNSADSRYYANGYVPVDEVVGRAFIQVWPPTDVGGL